MTSERGPEFAWRVHTAITDWTAKVDVKASIILALETALLGAVIKLSEPDQPLGGLNEAAVWVYRLGLVAVAVAIIAAGGVVMPRLASHRAKRDSTDGIIYFGHLRLHDAASLVSRLEDLNRRDELDQLAHQLVQTSRVAWRKHRWLQVSMWAALGGAALLALAWTIA